MKTSKTKFIIIFLVAAFAFQFITNSILGPEVRLFPENGAFFPGADSPVKWKSMMAAIIYPLKVVLVGPPSAIFKGPDPAPPVLVVGFAVYWVALALIIYFLVGKIIVRKA